MAQLFSARDTSSEKMTPSSHSTIHEPYSYLQLYYGISSSSSCQVHYRILFQNTSSSSRGQTQNANFRAIIDSVCTKELHKEKLLYVVDANGMVITPRLRDPSTQKPQEYDGREEGGWLGLAWLGLAWLGLAWLGTNEWVGVLVCLCLYN